jgi:hypothetical protein
MRPTLTRVCDLCYDAIFASGIEDRALKIRTSRALPLYHTNTRRRCSAGVTTRSGTFGNANKVVCDMPPTGLSIGLGYAFYICAVLVPVFYLVLGGAIRGFVRGTHWEPSDFCLGIEMTLTAMASSVLNQVVFTRYCQVLASNPPAVVNGHVKMSQI